MMDPAMPPMSVAPGPEMAVPTKLHDVTIVIRKEYGCARVEPVPPEEFGISRRARSLKDAHYCYHEVHKAEDDLIAQGFDRAQLKTIPTAGQPERPENQSRDTVEDNDGSMTDSSNTSARYLKVTEHYIRMDYDDSGSKLWRVTTGGDQGVILKRDKKEDIIQVDVMPFAAMTPVIMTHRFFGRSIADLVMDIMRIKTAVLRQMLDNAYLANNPKTVVYESLAHERTIDDLLVNRPGGIIRAKVPGAIEAQMTPSIGPQVFPLLEYLDATREWRTGVTRQGQGIDANALQNQSATAVNQSFTAAQARMKLIARVFAETGIRDLFQLLHGTIRKNDTQANTVRLRNKWVQVDPRNWKTRDDMTISVGLGTGSKGEQVAHLTNILAIQKEMLLGKLPTVSPKNVYNTAAKLTERVGEKNPEMYFTDPDSPEGQQMAQAAAQQPPDPKIMQVQMQAQLDEKADQRKAQIEQVQAQADIATNQQKLQAEGVQSEREFELKKELAILTAQLEMQKFQAEEARKDREHAQKMDLAREQHSASMQQAEFGMVAGQEAHEQKMQQAKAKPKNDRG